MNINFGKEISKKRKEKGLTQADVATQFGITVQAVSKWERGLSKPRGEIYYKLVDFLGLDVEMPPTEKKKPLFRPGLRRSSGDKSAPSRLEQDIRSCGRLSGSARPIRADDTAEEGGMSGFLLRDRFVTSRFRSFFIWLCFRPVLSVNRENR